MKTTSSSLAGLLSSCHRANQSFPALFAILALAFINLAPSNSASDCVLTFPQGTVLNAEVVIYPNFTVPPNDPDWTHGFTTPAAWFAVKVSDPAAPLPVGVYGAFCVDQPHFIPASFFVFPGEPYSGTLLST